MPAEDFLLPAALGALEGFSSSFIPFTKARTEDELTRRREREKLELVSRNRFAEIKQEEESKRRFAEEQSNRENFIDVSQELGAQIKLPAGRYRKEIVETAAKINMPFSVINSEGKIVAKGGGKIIHLPSPKLDNLSVSDALKLGVPFGTKPSDAKGIIPRSEFDKKLLTNLDAARVVISSIKELSKKVNTFEAGKFGEERLIKGGQKVIGSFLQTDPDAVLLDSKEGVLSEILVAMKNVGVLSDKDIARGRKLVPIKTDTKTVAQAKINELNLFFNEIKNKTKSFLTTPLRNRETSFENDDLEDIFKEIQEGE